MDVIIDEKHPSTAAAMFLSALRPVIQEISGSKTKGNRLGGWSEVYIICSSPLWELFCTAIIINWAVNYLLVL